jgi:hypothetical protein
MSDCGDGLSVGEFRNVLLLSAIHPWTALQSELRLRDFGREVSVAQVGKPHKLPEQGMVLPVMLQASLISDDVKSRLHRRCDSNQLTSFFLEDYEFTGKIIQIDYRNSPVNGRDSVEIMTFVIGCLT